METQSLQQLHSRQNRFGGEEKKVCGKQIIRLILIAVFLVWGSILAGCSSTDHSTSYDTLKGKTFAGKQEECIVRRIHFVTEERMILTFFGMEKPSLEGAYFSDEENRGFFVISGEPVSFYRVEDTLKLNTYPCSSVHLVKK
ncbi:hypothetical protein ACFQRH_13240 [Emcibacter nanhaiensis]